MTITAKAIRASSALAAPQFSTLLDRRNGHVDNAGLIVQRLTPNIPGGQPLKPVASGTTFTPPGSLPAGVSLFSGWDFNNDSNTATPIPAITGGSTPTFSLDNSPAPSTVASGRAATPAATALGMTNSYTYSTQAASIHAAGSGYAVGDTGTFGTAGGTYTVTAVTAGTGVSSATVSPITAPSYVVGTNYVGTATTGTGSGLSLKVTGTVTTGSVNGDDVLGTTLSSDPSIIAANNPQGSLNIAPNDNNAWRIRGVGTASGSGQGSANGAANTGNGWNNAAPLCSQGAQFMGDTTGYHYIVFQFDWYTTNQGVRDLQVLYTTNGGSTWTPVGPVQVSAGGSAFNNQVAINFHALGITGVENNTGFGIQLVSVYDPAYQGGTGYSIPPRQRLLAPPTDPTQSAQGTYTGAALDGATNQPDIYNNNSGNWRFDEINILGTANNTNPITSDPITSTTGLVNPDGILAVVPNTSPIKVLYISKTLNSDYVAPTKYPLCPASVPNGNLNDDVEVVRVATTSNFVNFTDITPTNLVPSSTSGQTLQMVNGLSDPAATSYTATRWVAPNGTLLRLSNGNWGLFFGGGNCLDGDSDAFHAIMYAESNGSDLTSWTVINGINNPVASIAQQTNLTDPQTHATGTVLTIPATVPVSGRRHAGLVQRPRLRPAGHRDRAIRLPSI